MQCARDSPLLTKRKFDFVGQAVRERHVMGARDGECAHIWIFLFEQTSVCYFARKPRCKDRVWERESGARAISIAPGTIRRLSWKHPIDIETPSRTLRRVWTTEIQYMFHDILGRKGSPPCSSKLYHLLLLARCIPVMAEVWKRVVPTRNKQQSDYKRIITWTQTILLRVDYNSSEHVNLYFADGYTLKPSVK